MNRHLTYFLYSLLVWTNFTANSQDYVVNVYNSQNGFNRSYVNDIEEDEEGYLWLATESGIVRFDGINFVELTAPAADLWTQGIRKLYLHKNSLYGFGSTHGLYRVNLKDYRVQLMTRDTIADLVHINPNEVFWLYRNGWLRKKEGDRVAFERRMTTQQENHLMYLYKGGLYLSLFNEGIFQLDPQQPGSARKLQFFPKGYDEKFTGNAQKLYYISVGKLYQLDERDGEFKANTQFKPAVPEMNYFITLNDREQYFLLAHKFLGSASGKDIRIMPLPEIKNHDLRTLFISKNNSILIGTNQALVRIHYSTNPIVSINDNDLDHGNALRVRRKILTRAGKDLLLLGSPNSYLKNTGGSSTPFIPLLQQERFNIYDAVWAEGTVYGGSEGQGLVKIDVDRQITKRLNLPSLNPVEFYTSVYYDSTRSLLIAATPGNLDLVNLETQQVKKIPFSANRVYVMDILKDPVSGRYLFGTSAGLWVTDSSFSVLPGFSTKPGDKLHATKIGALLLRNNTRELWVAHDKGCIILDADTYQVRSSLPENIFKNPKSVSILEDRLGRIWIGTYSGLVGFDPKNGNYLRLGKINNLMNEEFNYKSAAITEEGKLVFGGLNGYDIIDPALFSFDRGIRGRITGYLRIGLNGTTFTTEGVKESYITFNTDDEVLRLFLAPEKTFSARKLTFEYRIDDEPWISLINNSVINIYFLRQGLHSLNIRAFDEFGTQVNFPKTRLMSRVPIYKTTLFLWTLVLVSAGSLLLYILSVYWSRGREEKIKDKISMDLHDEVGTALTRAIYISQYGAALGDGQSALQPHLSEALHSLRTFINTMNVRTVTRERLSDELREMMGNSFTPLHITPVLRIKSPEDFFISGELYRDLKLMMYELISNTIRHAQATQMEADLWIADDQLHLRARDNGCLATIDVLFNKGNGIGNMKKRVARNKGSINFTVRKEGSGLEVYATFALN